MNPTLIKSRSAEAVIAPFRIVKHGAADHGVVQGAAATDFLCGVSGALGADAAGDRIDINVKGIVDVEYGGIVTRGKPLTSDADGKAVEAAPVAGSNVRLIGFADVSGVAGDIGGVDIAPGVMQG